MGALGTPFGLHLAKFGFILSTLGLHLVALGSIWPPWGSIWAPWGSIWAPLGFICPPLGSILVTLGESWAQVSKKLKKTTLFRHFLEPFWGRVPMQSVHACAVQTHIRALFLTPFSRPQKNKIIEMVVDSRGGHLGHISDKGGTGRHLRGLAGLAGRYLR